MRLSAALKQFLVDEGLAQSSWTSEALYKAAILDAVDAGKISAEKLSELLDKEDSDTTPSKVFGGSVRVKRASERYSTTKSVGSHATTGRPVVYAGREVEQPSQLEAAKSGVLLKVVAQRAGMPAELTEHEKGLLNDMLEHDSWCGKIGGEYQTGIPGSRIKALINDATSGGLEVVPEFFDSQVVTYPLLHSELLPRVDLIDVGRGSKIETGAISTPTAVWGTAEGTEMGLFDTTGLVAELDCDVHPVSTAIEIGRDLLADSPVALGSVLTRLIGERMLAEVDRVIAVGNGSTEPQGLFNASGITDIGNPAGGDGAAPQVSDYETLLFSVPKQYRQQNLQPSFVANDITYSRLRGIPVGAADERRVFGMAIENYQVFDRKFCVSNNVQNNLAAFGCLKKYRLYRRQGQEVRFESGGKELARKNLTLLIVRGRFGGRVVDPNAFAFSDNWQA